MTLRRFARWALGPAVASVTVLIVWALPGPDPCLPIRCRSPSISIPRTPLLEGTLSGPQAVVLFVGLAASAVCLARALAPSSSRFAIVAAIIASVLLAGSITGSSSVTGVWYGRDGVPLPDGMGSAKHVALALAVERGPKHCDWNRVIFLDVVWPIGTTTTLPLHAGSALFGYVRDPAGAYPTNAVATSFEAHAALPPDARYTGYHRGTWQLWMSSSRLREAVWLRSGNTVERWPYISKFFGCA